MKSEIRTFSPVHIGTGEQIYPLDYVVKREYYIRYRLENLVEQKPSRADDLASEVESFVARRQRGKVQFSLNNFLTEDEIWNEENYEYSGFIESQTSELIANQLREGYNADLFETIKTVQNKPYIPGSSIKGSIRTAIAYTHLKRDNRLFDQVKRDISDWLRTGRRRHKKNIGELTIEKLFRRQMEDIYSDILKAVRVSDTQPVFPDEDMGVCATKTVSIGGRYDYKPWWNFYEVIWEDTSLSLNINFNNNWLENQRALELLGWDKFLKGKKLDQNFVIHYCNDFASDLIDHEIDFYEKHNRGTLFEETLNFYHDLKYKAENLKRNECILRLGKGTGWTGITAFGLHLLRDSTFDLRSYRRKTKLGKSSLFPKSRLIESEKKDGKVKLYWPLGWVILSFTK